MLWLARWLTPWAGLSRERVGPVGGADTGSVPFVPLKPVTKRASAVGQGTVVGTVTVFEYASVHPSYFVCRVQRGQRPPQFLIEQHRGITAIADHCAARGAKVIADRSGCRCVIELLLIVSRGSDAVSAAWDTLLRTNEVTK
jgi:hypothetical protein